MSRASIATRDRIATRVPIRAIGRRLRAPNAIRDRSEIRVENRASTAIPAPIATRAVSRAANNVVSAIRAGNRATIEIRAGSRATIATRAVSRARIVIREASHARTVT